MGWINRKLTGKLWQLSLAMALWSIMSCNTTAQDDLGSAPVKTVFVNSRMLDSVFKLTVNKSSVSYVRLQTNANSVISSVNQIRIYKGVIYILDKPNSAFLLFDISGRFLKKTTFKKQRLLNFDIHENAVYLLSKRKGVIYKMDLRGKIIKSFTLGLQGVQFLAVSDTSFIFNTAGLETTNKLSASHQLSEIYVNGKQKFHLPFADPYQSLCYYFNNQLSRSDSGISFTSAFKNISYTIKKQKVTSVIKFDFGKYNMPDSIFIKLKAKDDFNSLPYVTDLANPVKTKNYSFFTLTLKNRGGYLLLRNTDNKLLGAGTGIEANADTDFNNIAPLGSYNDRFFTLVRPTDLLLNKAGASLLFSAKQNNDLNEHDNPILMFYSL